MKPINAPRMRESEIVRRAFQLSDHGTPYRVRLAAARALARCRVALPGCYSFPGVTPELVELAAAPRRERAA